MIVADAEGLGVGTYAPHNAGWSGLGAIDASEGGYEGFAGDLGMIVADQEGLGNIFGDIYRGAKGIAKKAFNATVGTAIGGAKSALSAMLGGGGGGGGGGVPAVDPVAEAQAQQQALATQSGSIFDAIPGGKITVAVVGVAVVGGLVYYFAKSKKRSARARRR